MSAPAGRISGARLTAFAAPCLPLAAVGLPLVVYLPEYYSNSLGLPVAAVGLAFLTVRLADIGFDPLFGLVLDRTRTPIGRYRPWLMVAGVLLIIACAILFFAKPGVSEARLWIGLLVAYAAFSIGVLSQTAWGARLSDDYEGRTRIYAVWQGFNVLGLLLAMITR
ncbi:MAG: transporter [Caulobacteraceae bacterium]|nr:transporter [Caulobacteraceae bacterium]